jgi:hypothetical protein
MEIKYSKKIDMSLYGKTTACNVYCIHVKVKDINASAKTIIKTITDISWISKLSTIPQITFEATSKRTILKLVNGILRKVKGTVTEDFGEYLISFTAQNSLETVHSHIKLPLAELLKEKVSGNPGFDYHTESHLNNIIFGEAKYSGTETPRADALDQISKFIDLQKDDAELNTIQYFVSKTAITNYTSNKKGYVAAFSLNSENVNLIFRNALQSEVIDKLICYPELYIIAIEV